MASDRDIELNELDLDATISPLLEEDKAGSAKSDVNSQQITTVKFTSAYSQKENTDSKSDSLPDMEDDVVWVDEASDNYMDTTLVQVSRNNIFICYQVMASYANPSN